MTEDQEFHRPELGDYPLRRYDFPLPSPDKKPKLEEVDEKPFKTEAVEAIKFEPSSPSRNVKIEPAA